MQTHDLVKFTALLAELGERYGKFISEQLIDSYWQVLKVFDWEDVKFAFEAHLHNLHYGQFFPKPIDIVDFIEENGKARALSAWVIVARTMQQVGIYQSVVFDDSLIHVVVEEMGGWIKLCAMTNDDLPFRAREFQKRYLGFVTRKPARYPKCLYGLSACENAKNGYAIEPPLLIGDRKKAEQVMLNGDTSPLIIQHSRPIQDLLQHRVKQLEENNHESD